MHYACNMIWIISNLTCIMHALVKWTSRSILKLTKILNFHSGRRKMSSTEFTKREGKNSWVRCTTSCELEFERKFQKLQKRLNFWGALKKNPEFIVVAEAHLIVTTTTRLFKIKGISILLILVFACDEHKKNRVKENVDEAKKVFHVFLQLI